MLGLAFYTDKVNIDEELTRLKSHVSQFRKIITSEESGKKLDFLMQEFNREAKKGIVGITIPFPIE